MKAICDNCMNWEDPAESKAMGIKRTPKYGYCTLFQKETTRNHGEQCTGHEPWPGDTMTEAQAQNNQADR